MKKTILIIFGLLLLTGCRNTPAGEAAPAATAQLPAPAVAALSAPTATPTPAPIPEAVPSPDQEAETTQDKRILGFCVSILDQLPCSVDLDGDGENEIVDLIPRPDELDSYPRWAVQLTKGNEAKLFETDIRTDTTYDLWVGDLDEDGGYEIFFHGDLASDDYIIYAWRCDLTPILFEPDDRWVRQNDQPDPTVLCSAVASFEDGHLEAEAFVDMLGTHWGFRTYVIGIDGRMGPMSSAWEFDEADRPLTVKKALTAYKARVRKDPGEAFTLEPGDKIYVTASDGYSRMWFETESGKGGVLLLTPDEDPLVMWRIDGIPEAEYFDYLPYSG